jgi:hypothetical protein
MTRKHPILDNPQLSDRAKLEIIDLQDYLASHATSGFDKMPEKTISNLLNQASPEARAFMLKNKQAIENFIESGGREVPFEPKRAFNPNDIPPPARALMEKSQAEEMTHSLNERMGTPKRDTTPPSMRDYLDISFATHEGENHG